ncbi:MAG TPA: hypothetical protein VGB25_03830, partial [Candidatus Binatia bacterium]
MIQSLLQDLIPGRDCPYFQPLSSGIKVALIYLKHSVPAKPDARREGVEMDMTTMLLSSTLFGSIGVGYFIYGKKQAQFVPLLSGIFLCVYPYFVSN